MSTGTTTRTITIAITRDPALVRTVRLVAAAVARRTGQDEEFVEEVRLAVGEACALLVAEQSEASDPFEDERVTVSMTFADRLEVRVAAPGLVRPVDPLHQDIDGIEPWMLLRGLIGDVRLDHDGHQTVLTMSWPLV